MNSALLDINGPWMDALGWMLIHSLWQGMVWALLLALALSFISRMRSETRYFAAWVSLTGMSASMLITFIYYAIDPGTSAIHTTEYIVQQAALVDSLYGNEIIAKHQWIHWVESQLPNIVLFWMIGIALLTIRWTGGWIYAYRLKYRGTQPVPADWQEQFNTLKKQLQITQDIGFKLSRQIDTPAIIGHFKPLVLMPVALVNALEPREVEAILVHELTHIARRDYLWHLVQIVLETICFYHPGVWYISRQLRRERENACDAAALRQTGAPALYANTLVKLQEFKGRPPALAMAFGGGKKRSTFFQRIQRILYPNAKNQYTMEKGFISIIGLFLTIWLTGQLWGMQPGFTPGHFDLPGEVTTAVQDTSPEENTKHTVIEVRRKGERWRIVRENGEIKELEKDGQLIPPEEYDQYREQVELIIAEIPDQPPAPPKPPRPLPEANPPQAPDAPDAPQIERDIRVRKMVDSPPSEFERRQREKEIKIRKRLEREELEDARIEIRKHMEQLRQEQHEMRRKLEQELRQHDWGEEEIERYLEQFGEGMEELGEGFEGMEFEFDFDEYMGQAPKMYFHRRSPHPGDRDEDEVHRFMIPHQQNIRVERGHYFGNVGDAILHILQEEGALEEDEDDYKIVLTDKKLKVNGSRQDDDIHERILELYEDRTGMEVEDGSRIVWKND